MTTVLKRFTAFAWGPDDAAPEVYVNPALVISVTARVVRRGLGDTTEGTRITFLEPSATQLEVREPLSYVVFALQSGRGGVCKDCYQLLEESWRLRCDDCTRAHKLAEIAADEVAAEQAYRDMLAHPESVVDAQDLP